jgi:hypothetical protein
MYECDKCIPSHTKLLLASLQSRSATPLLTIQQVAGFVCRPTQSMQNQKWSYGLTVFVAACPSSSGSFPLCGDSAIRISSVWVMLSTCIVFVKSGHLHFICQTLLAPLVFAFPPTSGAKKVRKEHTKQEQSASASSDSSVHKRLVAKEL